MKITKQKNMNYVKPKKSLGQHFLKDQNIAGKIVNSLSFETTRNVLEIGPGKGILTKFLIKRNDIFLKVVEIDKESVEYIKNTINETLEIIHNDVLKLDLKNLFQDKFCIIGNFPYNISSQIFFQILEYRDVIPEIVCMVQKEMAERIASVAGKKSYGILSVLLQAYYDIKILFKVSPGVFEPPPNVQSAVIRLTRNKIEKLDCSEELFVKLVKTGFNQRRKMLRNSIKNLLPAGVDDTWFLEKRPEQLTVNNFVDLARKIEQQAKTTAL